MGRDVVGKAGHARQQLRQRQGGHHRVIGHALPGHQHFAPAKIQRLHLAAQIDLAPLNAGAQRARQRLDAALLGIEEADVVAHAAGVSTHRTRHHFFEIGQRHEARAPVGSDGTRVHAPQLLVVGDHEVPGDPGAKMLQAILLEVARMGTWRLQLGLDDPQ